MPLAGHREDLKSFASARRKRKTAGTIFDGAKEERFRGTPKEGGPGRRPIQVSIIGTRVLNSGLMKKDHRIASIS